jgi:hypothetical protein
MLPLIYDLDFWDNENKTKMLLVYKLNLLYQYLNYHHHLLFILYLTIRLIHN